MKRIELTEYGPPSVLKVAEAPVPEIGDTEALVAMKVVPVSAIDCAIRAGRWKSVTFPYVPGVEGCGVVEKVGKNILGFAPGDRVISILQKEAGNSLAGGYCSEYFRAGEEGLIKIPKGIELDVAASLGLAGMVALDVIEFLDVKSDLRVLIDGASGVIGSIAVQLVKQKGATAIGTTLKEDRMEWLKSIGCDQVVCTAHPEWYKQIEPVDRVFDLVGKGNYRYTTALVKPWGRHCYSSLPQKEDMQISGDSLVKPIDLTGYSSERINKMKVKSGLDFFLRLLKKDQLKLLPIISFPLEEVALAHAELEADAKSAKFLLRIGV